MKRLLTISALTLALLCPAQMKAQNHLTLSTVTLDAGHGGHDPGCISADKRTQEKDVALDIVLRVNRMLKESYEDLNVVLTRDKDVFVPLEDRAKINNAANSDLFISVHVNAAVNTRANGFSVHCLGQSQRGNDLFGGNLELVKRENSVILLEEDHEAKYEGFNPDDPESYIFFSLIQNAHLGHSLMFADEVARSMAAKSPIRNNRGISQDPFWVLWRTASPAVLIEVGFMSNPTDLEKLRTENGREEIAKCIVTAFKNFKKIYDSSSSVNSVPKN
ncbi:MAG: N-acetylmuramoyl-L-alanine amidase [Bacteroidales bacterium]|nr:N-acetylmuramoyl-L-alanine amidase [Bacteroidales bacterium]